MNDVRDNGLAPWAPTRFLPGFATLTSSRTTHVDFNGDGRDEAVAGIKSTDTHTLS
jgi:hypothetical protein